MSQVRIVQRELNDRISHFLISSILVNMIGAYLLFKSLNTAFSDQFSVPVNGVSGDTTDTGSLTDVVKFLSKFQDIQFLLNIQIEHRRLAWLDDFGYSQLSTRKIGSESLGMIRTDFNFLLCDRMFQRRLDEVKLVSVAERMVVAYFSIFLHDAHIVQVYVFRSRGKLSLDISEARLQFGHARTTV